MSCDGLFVTFLYIIISFLIVCMSRCVLTIKLSDRILTVISTGGRAFADSYYYTSKLIIASRPASLSEGL